MFDWHALLNACRALAAGEAAGGLLSYGMPAGLFLLGLVGGVTHCAGMCGPFVLAQVGRRFAATPLDDVTTLTRLQGAALLPYHLGRAATYTGLGAATAGVFGGIMPSGDRGVLPAAVLLLAAAAFVLQAVVQAWPGVAGAALTAISGPSKPAPARWSRMLAPLFARPTGIGGFLLGLALGFLPCGLVYSAILISAAQTDAVRAAAGMAAFAAGTIPALFVVGWIGVIAGQRFRAALRAWMVPVLLLNAAIAAGMALRALSV